MKVRALTESDRNWAAAVVMIHFATPEILSRGTRHDTRTLPGLVAEVGGEKRGLAHYCIEGVRCEIVTLVALLPREGIGRRLVQEIVALARARGCCCLFLVTTNDNHIAQAFFEALGWKLIAVHRGAVAASRRLKPEIPDHAADGTPIEDELEYEYELGNSSVSAQPPEPRIA